MISVNWRWVRPAGSRPATLSERDPRGFVVKTVVIDQRKTLIGGADAALRGDQRRKLLVPVHYFMSTSVLT